MNIMRSVKLRGAMNVQCKPENSELGRRLLE